jgi:DMSO/TMAO reductase YedYZ molybdopterin-dependent catalytic subunit
VSTIITPSAPAPTRSGWQNVRIGALLGVVSAGAGLAVSELASGILHQRVSPVGAVAESIIRLTPGPVIEKVIHLVGHHDKQLLVATTLIGLAVVSAGVGILSLRSILLAELAFLVMGVVLALAVHARLTPSQSTYIPAIVGVAVAVAVLAILSGRGRAVVDSDATPERRATSRREFLQATGLIALAAVLAGVTGRVLAHGRAAVEAARSSLHLPIKAQPTPAGAEVGVTGIVPWVTTQDDFYRIDTALVVPQILPKDWSLRIHGLVDRELTLSYQDLLDRGLTSAWLTLCCVSNVVGGDLISNAWFSGVRIADILADLGVSSEADAVQSRSSDGWTAGTPIAALTDDRNAMLAVAMNGQPLAPEHGFPVRMVVPGLYGYVSGTKWVVDMEVTTFDSFSAFWTERGWSPQGPIKTESRIDVPHNGQSVSAGTVAIGGVAWAQHTGIAKVEVQIDDDGWVEATLGTDPSIDSWRQWTYAWDAPSGKHQIEVRATDDSGYTQTGDRADVIPDGATGWHTITVDVS